MLSSNKSTNHFSAIQHDNLNLIFLQSWFCTILQNFAHPGKNEMRQTYLCKHLTQIGLSSNCIYLWINFEGIKSFIQKKIWKNRAILRNKSFMILVGYISQGLLDHDVVWLSNKLRSRWRSFVVWTNCPSTHMEKLAKYDEMRLKFKATTCHPCGLHSLCQECENRNRHANNEV